MKSNFLKFPRLKNPPRSHLVDSTLRLPHRSSYSTPSLGCKEHSGQQSSKGEMPCLSFSENIPLNIQEAPVKRSPSSNHEVGNGQVDQIEVDRRSHRLVEDHLVVKRVDVRGFLSKMYFVPCWRERWKEFDWNKEVTKGWGESYFWRITPSHQHLLYFDIKFEAKPQACTKHFTNNIFEIMKNYRKYDKDISDDGDQDEKNNCCLDMSIWTLSVSFFLMSHFGHLGLHYGWFFTVWKLVYYLFYFHITCWLFTRHAQKQRHLRR